MKIKVENSNNLPTISYKSLVELQGDFKTITPENLAKLKRVIIKQGFIFPAFVWIDNEIDTDAKNDIYYIIDAHQRKKALESLESENYTIPEIPYIKINAQNKKDAVEKLIQLNSPYGKPNPETSLFADFDIEIGELDIDFGIEFEIPDFEPTGIEEQGKLDELEPIIVKCPHCGKEFDSRKA